MHQQQDLAELWTAVRVSIHAGADCRMILQFGIGSQNDNCIESYRNLATCAGKDVILSQDVRTSFLPSCPPKKTLGGYEEVPSTFKLACADSLCNASSCFGPVLVSLLPLLPWRWYSGSSCTSFRRPTFVSDFDWCFDWWSLFQMLSLSSALRVHNDRRNLLILSEDFSG